MGFKQRSSNTRRTKSWRRRNCTRRKKCAAYREVQCYLYGVRDVIVSFLCGTDRKNILTRRRSGRVWKTFSSDHRIWIHLLRCRNGDDPGIEWRRRYTNTDCDQLRLLLVNSSAPGL